MFSLNHRISRLLAHICFTFHRNVQDFAHCFKRSKYFGQSSSSKFSLGGASCRLFSLTRISNHLIAIKLLLSLLSWAVMSLVNPWRAALQSLRSTPNYFAQGTTVFIANNGMGTHHALTRCFSNFIFLTLPAALRLPSSLGGFRHYRLLPV